MDLQHENKIVTLIDNCVYGRVLKAEHGLSVYIEKDGNRILFDTGASDQFIVNARLLHIDLKKVNYLILSHGHSDHTGGLKFFLEYNDHARVICKPGVFVRKFKGERENGMTGIDEKYMSRFDFHETNFELLPGLFVVAQLPIYDLRDTHFNCFELHKDGQCIPDTFEDELALSIVSGDDMTVVSACSHRGITNILRAIVEYLPGKHLKQVIGGYHIHLAGNEKSDVIASYFQNFPDCKIGVCHCSGVDQFARFYSILGDRVFYNHVGLSCEI